MLHPLVFPPPSFILCVFVFQYCSSGLVFVFVFFFWYWIGSDGWCLYWEVYVYFEISRKNGCIAYFGKEKQTRGIEIRTMSIVNKFIFIGDIIAWCLNLFTKLLQQMWENIIASHTFLLFMTLVIIFNQVILYISFLQFILNY